MKSKIPQNPSSNKFKKAVEATPDITGCWKEGLRALGNYSHKVELTNPRSCDGSVEIDQCTADKGLYAGENRWDYVISYQNQTYFVEVHAANSSDVKTVLLKLRWLENWLKSRAPEISKLKAPGKPFYWIQSGKFAILPGSKQSLEIAQSGLRPVSKLKL